MRISDWSSDVCSSDLSGFSRCHNASQSPRFCARPPKSRLGWRTGKPFQYSISGGSGHFALSAMKGAIHAIAPAIERPSRPFQSISSLPPSSHADAADRKHVVEGKSVSVREDHVGGRTTNKKKKKKH